MPNRNKEIIKFLELRKDQEVILRMVSEVHLLNKDQLKDLPKNRLVQVDPNLNKIVEFLDKD